MSRDRPITLGLVANEFFDPGVGRLGGFGWAVSRVARLFADDLGLAVTPVIMAGEPVPASAAVSGSLHGVRFLPRTWNAWSDRRRLRAARPDVLRKRRALASARALVNTSVHEALAVSFLEALACETPLLAMVDAGGLVSRFGVCAMPSPGTGLDRLDALADGLRQLLGDRDRRDRLGREGRQWVEHHHGRGPLLAAFGALVQRMGVR